MDRNVNNPTVTVLLPAYNEAENIEAAIYSVIDQTFHNFEVIVIDDGSIDNTVEIVKKIADERIIIIKNDKNLGIQKTLNKGIRKAEGEYIARIDGDDRWIDKEKLEKQISFLQENDDYALIGTGVIQVDTKGKEINRYLSPEKDQSLRRSILNRTSFVHSSVIFRKKLVKKLGGYSEAKEARHVEDYDLWLRIGKNAKMYNLQSYSVKNIKHRESISAKNEFKQFWRSLKLAWKYKKDYPNAVVGIGKHLFRIIFYGVLHLPRKNTVLKILKNTK